MNVGLRGRPHALGNVAPLMKGSVRLKDFLRWSGQNFDPSVSWKDLEFLRAHWPGPMVIKGILDVEDARIAADIGAEGVVVSNHGGRQLDGALRTAQALPAIAAAVGDRLTVLADGGVPGRARYHPHARPWRKGRACRAGLGLCAGGWRRGGRRDDDRARRCAELRTGMALTGCKTIARHRPAGAG